MQLTRHSAVEYRLLQHAPVPGALQDAAAVYAHIVTHHLGARKGRDGKYRYPDQPAPHHSHARDISTSPDPIPLMSIPSTGQALNSETRLGNSAMEPVIGGNDAVPHPPINTVHSFQPNSAAVIAAHRPRIILIGDSSGGNLVLALARWIRDEGVLPVPDGMLLLSPSCDPCTYCVLSGSKETRAFVS